MNDLPYKRCPNCDTPMAEDKYCEDCSFSIPSKPTERFSIDKIVEELNKKRRQMAIQTAICLALFHNEVSEGDAAKILNMNRLDFRRIYQKLIEEKGWTDTAQAVQAERHRVTTLLQRRADAERADFNDSGLALYIEGLIAEIG